MKTCLSVTILCLQWGTYVIYFSKVLEHQKLFLFCAQPQKFHQASNHCLTAIIWMSLKYSRLRDFVKHQKREGKTYGFGVIWDHFCTAEERYLHHYEMETGDRVKNRKRQKTSSNCRKHICLLTQLAYSSVICLVKQIFQLRRRADTDSCVQGKSSLNIFSLLKRSSQAEEIKSHLSQQRECSVTPHWSVISSYLGLKARQKHCLILIGCCQAKWFNTQLSAHLLKAFLQRNHAVCIS